MLRIPRTEETSASGVGMQTWKKEEMLAKKAEEGSQWSGSVLAVARVSGHGGGIV